MKSSFLKIIAATILAVVLVASAEAQIKRKRKKIDRVIEVAKTYMGVPYQYGGISKSGIDCSGLIYNCYKGIDVSLPRTAKEQSKVGSRKDWDSVREGDIVFFKFKEKGEKWFHSGMISYAKRGDIRFIHASTSRGVVESNLNDDYYKKNVKRFRRVIK